MSDQARPQAGLDPARWKIVRFLLSRPFTAMVALIVIEALLAALTTWLVIKAGRDIANDDFRVGDFGWIVIAQSASYIIGAVSWVYAERAGFRAYGSYMLFFARENRYKTELLTNRGAREKVEPFLTNEGFHIFFDLMYELETDLKLFFGLLFNAIVLGVAIDLDLPLAYLAAFVVVLFLQWLLRNRIASAYLENQRRTNRMTAQSYTAWDNVLTGNRYNFRLWNGQFKLRLRDALGAQIRAIVAREGMSTISGIIGLVLVFTAMAAIVLREGADAEVLVALAATLPRQIEMAHDVHVLASAWNDLLALWTRIGGMAEQLRPMPDPNFAARIDFDRLTLNFDGADFVCASVAEAIGLIRAQPTGRIRVRGDNGTGKSSLVAELKSSLRSQAFFLPTADRLAWEFAPSGDAGEADEDGADEAAPPNAGAGFSAGERQIHALTEVLARTRAPIYLLDEWDANLDAANRSACEQLIDRLAARARCIEISHRDTETPTVIV